MPSSNKELERLRYLVGQVRQTEPWVELWEHLQGCREAAADLLCNLDPKEPAFQLEYARLRGELDALNRWFEFGDSLNDRMEQLEAMERFNG